MSENNDQERPIVHAQFPMELREKIAHSARSHDRSFSAELREAARAYLAGQEASPPRVSSDPLVGTAGDVMPTPPAAALEEQKP